MMTVATLPVTGILGFMMLKWLSHYIDARETIVRSILVQLGEMTIYIFVFHIVAFKVVSLIKIWWYGLEFGQIGCHMVIHEHAAEDLFWILYTVVGVSLPIIWKLSYDNICAWMRRTRCVEQVSDTV